MPETERDQPPVRPDTARIETPDLVLPATFGKYFLTEKLATGGMAEIYLAKLIGPGGFEKQLVIKQIHPRLSGQRHFVDLFVAEAKTLVALTHGNIVPVYELGVIDDTYFIAMEYIDGPTLYRLTEALRGKAAPMAPPIAAWITARILEGLDYAHRKGEGVIHRDLSPRNVMLSRDGDVKLVDFGIAVTLGTAGDDDTASAPTGSFPYMSPEQARKQPLTEQTDLFSVGVLFWEMLVGQRLFARPDPDATLAAVVDGDIPRPSIEHPDVPARLDDVVMRALERDLTARWTSAGDMLAALQRYLYSLDDPPGPRDISALVGRYCPPETRRLPTHHDWHADEPESTQPRDADPPRPGPATAVLPRSSELASANPRGKRHSRARTETFATHVAFGQLLEGSPSDAAATAQPDDHAASDSVDSGDHADRHERASTAPFIRDGADRSSPDEPLPSSASAPRRSPTGHAATSPSVVPNSPRRPSARHAATSPDATTGEPSAAIALTSTAASSASQSPPPTAPSLQLPGRAAPTASLLLFAGIGAIFLGGAAIFAFFRGASSINRPDAAPKYDAPYYAIQPDADDESATTPGSAGGSTSAIVVPGSTSAGVVPDAATAGSPATTISDAATAATAPLDATATVPLPPADARRTSDHDSALHPPHPPDGNHSDPTTHLDAGITTPTGTATLAIGATPWGDVILDGKRIGRTPLEHLTVPAGHHTIEVTFAGEDPPRTLRYTVDLANGDNKDVLADFTKPQ